jgi:hypothetical protein
MNLKSFPSLDRGASSTRAHPHSMGQHKLNRSIVASVLSLAAVATVCQPEKAAAVDLVFSTVTTANGNTTGLTTNLFGAGLGNGYTGRIIDYTNVAGGVNARVTATTFGNNYSFVGHLNNYNSANGTTQPNGDAGFIYQIAANQTGAGGMTYKIDLFDATFGNGWTQAYVAPDLRFSVYDVDGENSSTTGPGTTQGIYNQSEAVRVFKGDTATNSGFAGYQVGTATNSLVPTEDANSYLFTGPSTNYLETNVVGAALLYFQNTSSVTFQFEANTSSPTNPNPNGVFSAIDGDVSLIGNNATNFDASGHATTTAGFGMYQTATKIPEPFSIFGSLIGGGVAFGMRKKLKATSK